MTMELLTAGYLAVTIFYAWATFKIMQANQRTLTALQDQTDALLRPYVSISVVTLPNNVVFYLRIANTGKTGAENLRLTMDRDFYQYGQQSRPNLRTIPAFQQPIEQLPPGTEISFGLAQGFVILGENADPSLTPPVFTITATYSYGQKTVTETTTIDLRPYMQGRTVPDPIVDELKQIREKALKDIADQIGNLRSSD
jgi:hypothetical protein